MVLIWLFTAPVHQAWRWREAPLGSLDLLAALLFVALLALETVADQQMWAFQQDKKRVRERFGARGFQVFNAIGFTPAQMVLIWLFTAPAAGKCTRPGGGASRAPLGSLDLLAALLFVALLALETVADQQMWAFQQDKKRRLAAGEQGVQPFF